MPSGRKFVIGRKSRSCLSRCALSARVLLWHLFQRTSPLVIDTIRGYPSTLYNVVDLTNSGFLRNLLKNMDLQCPRYKELCRSIMIASISLPDASSSSCVVLLQRPPPSIYFRLVSSGVASVHVRHLYKLAYGRHILASKALKADIYFHANYH